MSEVLHEPFAVELVSISLVPLVEGKPRRGGPQNVHVRARQPIQCVETEACIFYQHRAAHLEIVVQSRQPVLLNLDKRPRTSG